MVTLLTNVLSVVDFVTLVAAVLVERGNDIVEESEFLDRLDLVLASSRVEVVVGALEDEAETLRHESDLVGLTPAEEEKSQLADTIVLGHLVHAGLPAVFSSLQAVVALHALQSLLLVLRVGLLRGLAGLASPPVGLSELHVGKSNRVIEIKMSSKVPAAVVGVLTSDVVGMEREKSLVGRHAGSTGVEQGHQVVEHVAHAVTLETELSCQVEEDVFDLLL